MNLRLRPFLVAVATAALGVLSATSAFGQTKGQASITLGNYDANYCYKHQNNWTLSKTADISGIAPDGKSGHVTWTVTATKSDGGTSFAVFGGLTITNTGSAPAPIGNIVINLQRKNPDKSTSKTVQWVSVGADVADSTNGDAATTANIVAAGSQENATVNQSAVGAHNYTVSGAKGTFVEGATSGSLEFTDCDGNTLFSLKPDFTLPVGASVTLLYKATFDVSALTLAKDFRVEALVSFANAGARGGSGASATDIDVDGNGSLEKYVRTVPARISRQVGPLEECNATATVDDLGLDAEGTAEFFNVTGLDNFPATISDTASWQIGADVDGGTDGGMVCNTATLFSEGDGFSLNVICPGDLLPVWVQCCDDISLSATACVLLKGDGTPPVDFPDGSFYTFTRGKYNINAGNPVAAYLSANFATLFPSGLTIGVADGAGPLHNATWTSATAFRTWIQGGGGPSSNLTADTLNATSTAGGTFGKQVGALTVTLALQGAVIPGVNGGNPLPSGLGDLYLKNTGTSLDGLTISQILAVANTALAGGGLPSDYTFSQLNTLIDNINNAFDDGITNHAWVDLHLSYTP